MGLGSCSAENLAAPLYPQSRINPGSFPPSLPSGEGAALEKGGWLLSKKLNKCAQCIPKQPRGSPPLQAGGRPCSQTARRAVGALRSPLSPLPDLLLLEPLQVLLGPADHLRGILHGAGRAAPEGRSARRCTQGVRAPSRGPGEAAAQGLIHGLTLQELRPAWGEPAVGAR